MSIKYLGDNQLNQIQNDPNDTPWAKLIAQSEMLERNKMRQPQGQFPQGTVASAIQQQLLNNQMQQANQVQGLDAEKARILAQLIGSGQLQGMADGGLPASLSTTRLTSSAQRYVPGAKQAIQEYLSKENAPDVAYEDVMRALSGRGMADGGLTPSMSNPQLAPMLGASPIKPQVAQTQLAPTKEAIDQQPHHDIFQRLLDNSIIGVAQGKGSLNDTLQLYADMWTGKALKGLADGGEIRGFELGGSLNSRPPYTGESMYDQMSRIKDIIDRQRSEAARAEYRARPKSPTGESTMFQNAGQFRDQMLEAAKARENANLGKTSGMTAPATPSSKVDFSTDRMGPPKGAAMSSPEAQAYLRDPSFIGDATKTTDFVGPQAGGEPPIAVKAGSSMLPMAGRALGILSLPTMIDEATGAAPDDKSAQEIKAAWEKGGVPEVFNYENAKAAANLGKAKDWMSENIGHPLERFWYGPKGDYDAMAGAPEGRSIVEKPQSPAPSAAPVTNQATTSVKPPITKDNVTEVAKAHGYAKTQSQVLDAAQKVAALNQTEQALGQTKGEDSTESIYRQFAKDADMDYAELAKRISENEKDLARERKDGTLTAILSGVGAALTRAGTYDQKGDRVFAPGIGQILGTGILGGLEASEAGEKKYQTGIEKNLDALAQLKGLKRMAKNDMMDAMNAERQIKATEANTAATIDYRNRELNMHAPYYAALTKQALSHAGSYERAGTNTGASKQLTANQLAGIRNAAYDDAVKQLQQENAFIMLSPEEQQTKITELTNILVGQRTGGANAATPPPASTADKFAGFKDLTGK